MRFLNLSKSDRFCDNLGGTTDYVSAIRPMLMTGGFCFLQTSPTLDVPNLHLLF
jgi:hypothetical protein